MGIAVLFSVAAAWVSWSEGDRLVEVVSRLAGLATELFLKTLEESWSGPCLVSFGGSLLTYI